MIEVLVLLAVLGVLASISIPNFTDAQVKARIAKAKEEMAALGVGLESYVVDHTKYPFDMDSSGWVWYITDVLTTPVKYTDRASVLIDPFREGHWLPPKGWRYRYINYYSCLEDWPPSPIPGRRRANWCARGARRAGSRWRWGRCSSGTRRHAG